MPPVPGPDVVTRAFRDGRCTDDGFALADVSEHLAEPGTVVWVDLARPSAADLELLADELGLHHLAVEDALSGHQRPKLDQYDTHLFLSCHAVALDPSGALQETEVDAFVLPQCLITIRKGDGFAAAELSERLTRAGDLLCHGVVCMVHALLDAVVDGYVAVGDRFDDFYDECSVTAFAERPGDPTRTREWFAMRRALLRFHRLATSMHEVLRRIQRSDAHVVIPALVPYFADVEDHLLRVRDGLESDRELASTLSEASIALRDFQQNQVMKQVTSWAAVIAVPTLISGLYGMNVPYPGSGQAWGAVAAFVLMAACSFTLWLLFRRRNWL